MNNRICATQKYLGWWAHHNLNKEKLRLSYIIDELEAIMGGRGVSLQENESKSQLNTHIACLLLHNGILAFKSPIILE
jgi:hypothetical protein